MVNTLLSGCQTQEKVVAASANTFVVIADDSKQSTYLGEKVSCITNCE